MESFNKMKHIFIHTQEGISGFSTMDEIDLIFVLQSKGYDVRKLV